MRDADGVTPDGMPFYDFTQLVADGTLSRAGLTGSLSLAFINPNKLPFTYDLVFLGKLNHPPAFTTVPNVEAVAGLPYTYDADATDPDGDSLVFSLLTGPTGIAVDRATGMITWSPRAADVGTHTVVLRVEDARLRVEGTHTVEDLRGGFAEQR
ncbi:MAG: Ig-like domain-containing protein [Planctomycetes bacterium]|nr:Ig-like domain-containing protein [Planctomycetota bacterium]